VNCIHCGNSQDDEYCFNKYCPYDDKLIRECCDGKIYKDDQSFTYDPTDKRDRRIFHFKKIHYRQGEKPCKKAQPS